ncbi:hypothetical protein ROD_27541 [Citrobacter rodentium ICC168]|uniref:Uncharacterized protein n=1 Tax=Citrobacter rodentium (strain ICC168) TaxID=637910 RepID=D2THR6_CITRI|nr:hypothetical protein ROD_27541 [Citrobacter rodentium ICC168]
MMLPWFTDPVGEATSDITHLSTPEHNDNHTFIIKHSYTTEANQSELTTRKLLRIYYGHTAK